ncbi:MAG: hypothetical protein A3D41_04380 [Candidatus Sungbacteria bacterium RIFCSPHIGHO2_02_FULL_41_12b]|nr:MAG: hypothetical protein A3D41_04380 [Candidatus Sungbacteria bacterium RIFCSPHIGHO2_02_FULL_41_12b]
MISITNIINRNKKIIIIILILVVGVFFRFYKITEIPPGLYPDEAINGNNALEALKTGEFKIFYPENNGREGLFINLQAVSLWFFGNNAWALRVVSGFFGTLTILGFFLLVYELFRNYNHTVEKETKESVTFDTFLPHGLWVATLSSFFLATSYWHINFSRIGFRAIMVPFFLAFGFYFLLKVFRTGKILTAVLAGIFIGLGFHTYIAFRLVPLILIFVSGWKLWQWHKAQPTTHNLQPTTKTCVSCIIVLFLLITFVVALPIGWYFLNHPEDFMGRQSQVSIFSSENPLKEFAISNIKTLGMFNVRGDCNQRHNFNCEPELFWPVGILFLAGVYYSFSRIWRWMKNSFSKTPNGISVFPHLFIMVWFLVMMLPSTLTKEGIPHAIRSIGLIVPVFIFAGLGSSFLLHQLFYRFHLFYDGKERLNHEHWRVRRGAVIFIAFFIIFAVVNTYDTYFKKFSGHAKTYFEFSTGLYRIGEYMASSPREINKYIIVNMDGVNVNGVPMPAQTVMFLTDSYRETSRKEKNIFYILPGVLGLIDKKKQSIIILLNPFDKDLVQEIREKFPEFKILPPEAEFYVFQNF